MTRKVITAIWTPVGSDDLSVSQAYDIGCMAFNMSDFERKFSIMYPNSYRVAQERFNDLVEISRDRIKQIIEGLGLQFEKIVDGDILNPLMLEYINLLILQAGGDNTSVEYERAKECYQRELSQIQNSHIWADINENKTEDEVEAEAITTVYTFSRGL
jgi:hypothetical protein